MDPDEPYTPEMITLIGEGLVGFSWLIFVAALFLYPFPKESSPMPLKIAVGWTSLLVALRLLWEFGAFGRHPLHPDYRPAWVIKFDVALQWGTLLGYGLMAIGAWVAARSLVRVWRADPLAALQR